MIIAIDGPTASGKGTVARALASHFGLPHLDTGLLYRAVGYQLGQRGGDPDDAADALAACDFPDALLDLAALRDEETGALASRVSVHPAVRAALLDRQRSFAAQPRGAVLDGRDIGTVIAPGPYVKLFVTARPAVRAGRRWQEMQRQGSAVTLAAMEADIAARDARDAGRSAAPLVQAPDAHLLDTSDLAIGAVVQQAIALVAAQVSRRS